MASTWTEQEDELLRALVTEYGAKKWATIAALLKTKGSKQCRRRWKNYLNVELKKGGWTPEEDAILLAGHAKIGNRWTEIAKHVGGRTDNAVKNRYAALCKRSGGPGDSALKPVACKSRQAAHHHESNEDDDSDEDEMDVASDFQHRPSNSSHPPSNSSHPQAHTHAFDQPPGPSSRPPMDLKQGLAPMLDDRNHAIPASAVVSATAALQAAIAAAAAIASQSLQGNGAGDHGGGLSAGGLSLNSHLSMPAASPTMLMAFYHLPSPKQGGGLQGGAGSGWGGMGAGQGGGSIPGLELHSPNNSLLQFNSGALDQLMPPHSQGHHQALVQRGSQGLDSSSSQLPIMQLKLGMPGGSLPIGADLLSPSSLSTLNSMEPPPSPSTFKRTLSAEAPSTFRRTMSGEANADERAAKRRLIPTSPWQQHYTGTTPSGLSPLGLNIGDLNQGHHQQGHYSQESILIQTAISSTPRTPNTPKLLATAQEAAARQVATAKALAARSSDMDGSAGPSTLPYPRGSEAGGRGEGRGMNSPSPTKASQAPHWSTLLSQSCHKRAYKKPGGLSISIPDAPNPVAQSNTLQNDGLAIRVYKDLLTPCELQYARELNDMDIQIQIELEDPPLSTSRRATAQALSALMSPTSVAQATPKSPSVQDILSWLHSSGSTPRMPSNTTTAAASAAAAAAPIHPPESTTHYPSDRKTAQESASASAPGPSASRPRAAGAGGGEPAGGAAEAGNAAEISGEKGTGGGDKNLNLFTGDKADSLHIPGVSMHSGHHQLLVKLIGGVRGNEEEESRTPGGGVIVPSPRRATAALSPTNYSFGLDSATGLGHMLLSPIWSGLDGLASARGGPPKDFSLTPKMSNDELKLLLEAITTEEGLRGSSHGP